MPPGQPPVMARGEGAGAAIAQAVPAADTYRNSTMGLFENNRT